MIYRDFPQVMGVEGIDSSRTESNHVMEVFNILGVEVSVCRIYSIDSVELLVRYMCLLR